MNYTEGRQAKAGRYDIYQFIFENMWKVKIYEDVIEGAITGDFCCAEGDKINSARNNRVNKMNAKGGSKIVVSVTRMDDPAQESEVILHFPLIVKLRFLVYFLMETLVIDLGPDGKLRWIACD